MAWQTSSRVWQHIKKTDIKQSDRLMLLALAEKADKDGVCWPWFDTSYETLGDMVGVNRRSAMRLVDSLCQAGYLIKVEVTGRGKSNYYLVSIGLQQTEIDTLLQTIHTKKNEVDRSDYAKNGVTDDTNSEINGVTDDTIEEKKLSQVTPIIKNGVTDDTNSEINGVTGNTPSSLKESDLKESIFLSLPKGKDDEPKNKSSPSKDSFAMFTALTDLCQIDTEIIGAGEKAGWFKAAKTMRDNGYTPKDVENFGGWWYANDWRGKQGQPPTQKQIKSVWGQYTRAKNGKGNSDENSQRNLDRLRAELEADIAQMDRDRAATGAHSAALV